MAPDVTKPLNTVNHINIATGFFHDVRDVCKFRKRPMTAKKKKKGDKDCSL